MTCVGINCKDFVRLQADIDECVTLCTHPDNDKEEFEIPDLCPIVVKEMKDKTVQCTGDDPYRCSGCSHCIPHKFSEKCITMTRNCSHHCEEF